MIFLTEKNQLTKLGLVVPIFFLVITNSCRKSDSHFVEINRYPSGELLSEVSFLREDSLRDGVYKEYYKNGNLKKTIPFKRGEPVDSAMQYFYSGQLEFKEIRKPDTLYTYHYFKTGELTLYKKFLNRKKPIEIGWSIYFNKEGSVLDSIEHVQVHDDSYLNQRIKYNHKKQLVIDSSNYFKFSLNGIPNSDVFDLKINYVPTNKNADVFMVLGENINNNFSNLNEIALDTIFMQNNEISSRAFEKDSKVFRGFFYEYSLEELEETHRDSTKLRVHEKKTFFNEKVIAIKPTE